MKNKRNQIIITALAIMIAIAGYINYTGSLSDIISIKDKDSVTASNEIDDEYVSGETLDITSTDEDLDVPGDGEVPGTAILTSAQISSAKLSREQIRAKNKEDLMEIVNSQDISDSAKQGAVNKLTSITDVSEKEVASSPSTCTSPLKSCDKSRSFFSVFKACFWFSDKLVS